MGWPKKVPILTASYICHEMFDGPKGTHCLSGWCAVVFPKEPMNQRAYAALKTESGATEGMAAWNDSHTKRQCAAVWNRAMARLGYRISCER